MLAGIQKPLLGQTIKWDHPLTKGLKGCWLFNEGGGIVTYDPANKIAGTLQNTITWAPDGLYFPVAGVPWVSVAGVPFYEGIGTGQYSIVSKIWHDPDSIATRYRCILAFDDYDPAWDTASPAGDVLTMWDGGEKAQANTPLKDGKSHMVGFVRYGTGANQSSYFVDSRPDGTFTHDDNILSPTTVRIGWNGWANDNWMGIIHFLYFYDRALSASEMAWIHHEPFTIFRPFLHHYFSIAVDVSNPPRLQPMRIWKGVR